MRINLARITSGIASVVNRLRGRDKEHAALAANRAKAKAEHRQLIGHSNGKNNKPRFDRAHQNRRNWIALQSRRRNRALA
jgi:hypothetical protein